MRPKILDKTGMKGTGRWTVQEAAEQSVAAPTIAASLDQRYISGRKDERVKAATILKGPTEVPSVAKESVSRIACCCRTLVEHNITFFYSILVYNGTDHQGS